MIVSYDISSYFFFQAEDGIRDLTVTGVQTCALPIFLRTVGGGRVSLEGVEVAHRDRDDHIGDDDDGEDDGDVEPLVVAEVPVVVAPERHHSSSAGFARAIPPWGRPRRGPPRPPPTVLAQQELSDLDRIRGRALSELIADHPEVQAGRAREILPDPADEAVVLALDLDRHRVALLRRIVPHLEPRAPL